MADEIYEHCVAAEEAFAKWWPKARAEFLIDEAHLETRRLAQAAFRAAWETALAPEEKTWSVTSAVLTQAKTDLFIAKSHFDAATKLAKRHGLVIENVGSHEKGRVLASKDGKFITEQYGWLKMVEALRLMEAAGKL